MVALAVSAVFVVDHVETQLFLALHDGIDIHENTPLEFMMVYHKLFNLTPS